MYRKDTAAETMHIQIVLTGLHGCDGVYKLAQVFGQNG